jgi:lipopolysaccharide export system permease protein
MILGMIWERYFFKEIIKVFFLFLFVFYFLYSVMDYSTHMQDFIVDKQIQISDILLYYANQFLKRADLLIPLALLIATIKVLSTLNANRELVALQASGVKLKKLLSPFFLLAGLCASFNYFSAECLLPKSLNYLDQFHYSHFKHFQEGKRSEPVHVLFLKDNSKLIYQNYDAVKGAFFDAIWLSSSDDIWRIKYLKADPNNPIGQYVDHLKRNSQGFFEKEQSYNSLLFKQIKWERNMPRKGYIPFENRSISELYRLLYHKKTASIYESKEILTRLCFKCVMPLLSFLVLIAITPFCIRYSRHLPIFFIYAFGLFGYISFFTLMDSAVILGENNIFPPLAAILIPFLGCTVGLSWKFAKIGNK